MEKLSGKTKVVKYLLIVFSFVQTNWVPIACGAAVVATAATFGDKSYMMEIGKNAESLIAEGKNAEAIEMLESKIDEYDIWRKENLDNDKLKSIDEGKFELYYQLAVTKEKAGFPQDQVRDVYSGGAIPDCSALRFENFKFMKQDGEIFAYDLKEDRLEHKTIYRKDFSDEMNLLYDSVKDLLGAD